MREEIVGWLKLAESPANEQHMSRLIGSAPADDALTDRPRGIEPQLEMIRNAD